MFVISRSNGGFKHPEKTFALALLQAGNSSGFKQLGGWPRFVIHEFELRFSNITHAVEDVWN
jgi:hypothetical protein